MRSVVVDKVASVALAADLGQEIRVSDEIPCEEGVLIAVEVLNNKSRYNTIELTSGWKSVSDGAKPTMPLKFGSASWKSLSGTLVPFISAGL